VGAIIITPTRELAVQIHRVVSHFKPFLEEARPLLLVGGTSVQDAVDTFRSEGATVLVATPGRLDDLLSNYDLFDTRELEVLILDEADTLLDMGFHATLTSILGALPKQRRTGLFSATQTRQVKDLARAGLRNPATIAVAVRGWATAAAAAAAGAGSSSGSAAAVQATPTTLRNYYMTCDPRRKLGTLVRLLNACPSAKFIVFTSTCASVDYLSGLLAGLLTTTTAANSSNSANSSSSASSSSSSEHRVLALHGRMVQKRRSGVFEAFLAAKQGAVLVCTDVAARGIDVPDVDWIMQYDPPQVSCSTTSLLHCSSSTQRCAQQSLIAKRCLRSNLTIVCHLKVVLVLCSKAQSTC
jgi:ATP-dependent RNA helicase DDX55/SPB4